MQVMEITQDDDKKEHLMSEEESTAVAEPETVTTIIPSLEDEYAGEAPGEEEVLPASTEPSGDDAGEEKKAAEETTEPVEAAEVEEPAFPQDLVEQAKQIGYVNPESFGTKENLQHAVDQFNQQISSLGQKTIQAPAMTVVTPAAPVTPAPAPTVAAPIPELKEFGEELDPEVREPLNRLVQRHKAVEAQQEGRMAALQQTVDKLEAQGVQQARGAIRSQVETFVAGLPKEYAEHLGKEQIDPIAEQIEILIAGYGAAGRNLPSDAHLLMAATRNVLGNKNETIIQKQTAAQVKKRQDQATARPAGQKSSRKQTDEAKAKKAIDEAWAKTGLPEGDDEETF